MIKEKFSTELTEVILTVKDGQIDGVRRKNIAGTGYKVYKDGKVGMVTALGNSNDETMFAKAEDELIYGSEIGWAPSEAIQQTRTYDHDMPSPEAFVKEWDDRIKALREKYPDWIIQEHITYRHRVTKLENSLGTHLEQQDGGIADFLTFQDRMSQTENFTFNLSSNTYFDESSFYTNIDELVTAHRNEVELPEEGSYPVFTIMPPMQLFLDKHLSGKKINDGSSYYAKKMQQAIFNPNLTLQMVSSFDHARTFELTTGTTPLFFDPEGTLLTEGNTMLIDQGKLVNSINSRKTSAEYGVPANGGTQGTFESLPVEGTEYTFKQTHHSLDDILQGRIAIFEIISPGGDFTTDGNYAAPCILSYLYKDGKLVGKLPPLQLSGHIDHMLGDGFLGACPKKFCDMGNSLTPVVMMDVKALK